MPGLDRSTATRAAMHSLRYHNKNTGTPRYGFVLGPDGHSLIQCEAEQRVLHLVKRLHQFRYSTRQIVKFLHERGTVSRSGKPFQQTQIVRMLRT